MAIVHQDPRLFGFACSRWTLCLLLQVCSWLGLRTPGSLSRLLKRLRIRYKRARSHVHSPDLDYPAKVAAILAARRQAEEQPDDYVLLYLDEVGFHRQPTLASAYEAAGHTQPLACWSHNANTESRVVGALHALTGQVLHHQQAHITVPCLVRFWSAIRAAFPQAKTIYVVLDNWPVHFHADALAALEPQRTPFPLHRPATWPATPSAKAKRLNLPIQLLPLPTYAPWLNPIEKLWGWLRKDVLHLHRLANDWPQLKQQVNDFLDRFAHGSPELLRYVGLLPD